jgi:ribosomal protein L30/L7E
MAGHNHGPKPGNGRPVQAASSRLRGLRRRNRILMLPDTPQVEDVIRHVDHGNAANPTDRQPTTAAA